MIGIYSVKESRCKSFVTCFRSAHESCFILVSPNWYVCQSINWLTLVERLTCRRTKGKQTDWQTNTNRNTEQHDGHITSEHRFQKRHPVYFVYCLSTLNILIYIKYKGRLISQWLFLFLKKIKWQWNCEKLVKQMV